MKGYGHYLIIIYIYIHMYTLYKSTVFSVAIMVLSISEEAKGNIDQLAPHHRTNC